MEVQLKPMSWQVSLLVVACMMGLQAVIHRRVWGTWRQDVEEWVPYLLGAILGIAIYDLVMILFRSQRTRNRPST